jgi:alpha-amylase/alpha-mannosidase (GH57 family)
MLDFQSAREAWPDASLPEATHYPGGKGRVGWHVQAALESHARRFGQQPRGMWPAEGAVSTDFAHLLAEQGLTWIATGEAVLMNTLHALHPGTLPDRNRSLYRPYRLRSGEHQIVCFFRDDRLSDLIGFEYAKWFGRDAVNNFIHELENVARLTEQQPHAVVTIALDGENAWEYYPYNAYYFLSELYQALESHPRLKLTTFHEYLSEHGAQKQLWDQDMPELPRLTAGSWVYGNYSTWVGMPAKNRAWDLLCTAKASYDLVMASGRLSPEEQRAAERQLAVCEGSDWFWWFGDYNPSHSVESFDRLYRHNLANLYKLIRLPVPEALDQPISHGGGQMEAGGTMRRAT